uniref:UBA domain-containing protein n=1 Tax=Meloidogyne incognita TaxID=6306 RepID=A0A914N7R8_MELIC
MNTFLTNFRNIPQILQKTKDLICSLSLFCDKENIFFSQKIEHFCQLSELICNLFHSISYICLNYLNNENHSIILNIIQILPNFIEEIWNYLADEKLLNVKNIYAESIIISRSKLLQSSLNLFCIYYNCEFVNNKRRLQLIIENLDKKEFIVRLDNEINLEREFSKFFSNGVCTENQLELSIKAINNAYEEKRKLIKNLLLRQRILKFIGFPKEKYISDQIQELSEIMSDLSNQQIHLCLRHFGYDIEKTTEALCQREQLPLNLKILLRVKDNLEEDNCCPKQALVSDENLGNISDIIYCDENNFKKILKEIEDLNESIRSNEATINIGGKLFAPKSSQKDLSEDERIALATASIKLAEMIEEENSNPNEIFGDDYDDEYNDTYENTQECKGVDIGTFTIDEDFESSSTQIGRNNKK